MALFKTIEEFKQYLGVSLSKDFERLLPDIEWAEKKYIIPFLGENQYNDLYTAYDEDTLTPEQVKLLDKVRMPLAHFTYSKYITLAQLIVDSSGISIVSDSRRKTAFQWQVTDLKGEYFLQKAYDGLDFLLKFLEDNKDDYPEWVNGEGYTLTNQFFINSTAQFNTHVNIDNSRLSFVALWQEMRRSETFLIAPILGISFFTELKAKLVAETLSTTEKELVEYIQPCLAYYTAGNAVNTLSLGSRGNGFTVENILASGSDNVKEVRVFNVDEISRMSKQYLQYANEYQDRLKTYLNTNASATVFKTYFDSSLYQSPTDATSTSPNKIEYKGFIM